jgi:hypothetical protein
MKRQIRAGLACLCGLGLSSCSGLLWPDGCGDCAGGAHWETTCIGWIAPVCDTYCVSTSGGSVQLLDACCCGDKAQPAPRARAWRPVKSRYG